MTGHPVNDVFEDARVRAAADVYVAAVQRAVRDSGPGVEPLVAARAAVRTPKRERAALRRSLRAAWGGFWVAKGFTRELSAFFAERLTRTSDAAAQRAAMAAAMALRRDGREMFRS